MKISDLFRNPDLSWGLRGDPYLWDALQKRFSDVEVPISTKELVCLLKTEYQTITGQPLNKDDYVYVEEFAHGGMSSGYVCPEYWRETAIPFLLDRFEKYKGRKSGYLSGKQLGVQKMKKGWKK